MHPAGFATNSGTVSLDVSAANEISRFVIIFPFADSNCTFHLEGGSIAIIDAKFNIGTEIRGSFNTATTLTGNYDIGVCSGVKVTPAEEGTWSAELKTP